MSTDKKKTDRMADMEKVNPQLWERVLQPDQLIRIRFPKEDGGFALDSKVLALDRNTVYSAGLEDLTVNPGALAQISFFTEKAIYSFVTRLIERRPVDEPLIGPLLAFEKPVAWKRIQRRSDFRLEWHFPVNVRFLSHPDDLFKARNVNISASGMLLAMERYPSIGDKLSLDFNLPGEDDPFHAEAEVIRQAVRQEGDRELFQFAIRLTLLNDRDRDRLAQILWKKTRERIMK